MISLFYPLGIHWCSDLFLRIHWLRYNRHDWRRSPQPPEEHPESNCRITAHRPSGLRLQQSRSYARRPLRSH